MSKNINLSKYRIGIIGDSPKITSGFAQVTRMFAQALHDAGFSVFFFGWMDPEPDMNGELPYSFQWTSTLDEMGHQTASLWLRKVKPDLVIIVTDPGTLAGYMTSTQRDLY